MIFFYYISFPVSHLGVIFISVNNRYLCTSVGLEIYKSMNKKLLLDIEKGSKNAQIKKRILNYYIENGDATIADLSRELDLSVPTTTKIINEMTDDGFVIDYGKMETSGGRRPFIYGLNPTSGYFVGVDIRRTSLNIGLINFKGEVMELRMNVPYVFENTPAALDELCRIVSVFISGQSDKSDNILNITVNFSGRVNSETGYCYSAFYFEERPLSEILSDRLGYRVSVENDTRAMAFGELMCGIGREEKNVIFVNISWGVGIGIIIDGKIYYGESGYSGEFGHISVFDNEILCHCGKKGCLETEASGSAIYRIFMERYKRGENSILSKDLNKGKNILLDDIIDAANKDDILSIEIIEEVGDKIGKYIAGLINIFNPGILVIGGSLAATGDYIVLPVKSAIRKYSLNLVNKDSRIVISKLKEKAGVIGACMLARKRLLELT